MSEMTDQTSGQPIIHVEAAPPRDPRIAEFQEFESARLKNDLATWDLFLARHPGSMYAAAARTEREKLASIAKQK